jgi:hypothetical protein
MEMTVEQDVMTLLRHPAAPTTAQTVESDPTVIALPGPAGVSLVPVRRKGRTVGVYLLSGGSVRYRPVVDADHVVSAVAAVTAVTVLGASVAAARRRVPAVGTVSMGPGGWVSFKGVPAPALRAGRHRPWWARLLRARRLAVEP